MTYVIDTNIVVFCINNSQFGEWFDKRYRKPENDFILSVVSEGELRSLAIQRKWGKAKCSDLEISIAKFLISPIKVQTVINAYAQIDAFSQGKLADRPLPQGTSARNMGKNDIWIAATAHATQATLLTTDHDFDHLHASFLDLDRVDVLPYL
jgi:predicted nucleic acid-binding protein